MLAELLMAVANAPAELLMAEANARVGERPIDGGARDDPPGPDRRSGAPDGGELTHSMAGEERAWTKCAACCARIIWPLSLARCVHAMRGYEREV